MRSPRAGARERPASQPTRRRVLRRSGVGLVGTVGIGGVTAAERSETDRARTRDARTAGGQEGSVADQPLLDVHTHLIPERTLDREPLDADGLVAWMDANGVDRAVVLALDSPESYPVQAPSWWILEQVAAYSDRLIPFCSIDPRTLVYEEDFDAVTELFERYLERGMRGFGELKAGVAIDDRRLRALYERCAEHDLPILFHTDDKAMLDEVGLPRLEDVLASFPTVDFVAHAHGWWSHISADVSADELGDYPAGPIEPGGRVPELLAEYDNVYGDVSGGSGWNALARDPTYAQEFLETHHDQLVFGTDYLYPGQEVPQLEVFDRFDLSEETWSDIRYRNLEDLLE